MTGNEGAPARVLHVIGNLGFGGVQQYLMSYLRHIDRSQVAFDFVVQTEAVGELEAEAESLGARVFHLPSSVSERLRFRSEFSRLLQEHPECEIVEAHMNFRCLLPLSVARSSGRAVRVAHSHSAYSPSSALRALYRPIFKNRVGSIATELWGCSNKANKWLYGSRPRRDPVVIPNAIDVSRFAFSSKNREAVRSRYGIGGLCVGHVGAGGDAKNYPFLLRSFARVLESEPDATLLLVGCSEGVRKGALLQEAKAMGVAKSVVFCGRVANPETYLSAVDVFAFPSLFEGLSIVVVEAQANGLRCVVSSDAVPREVDLCGSVEFLGLADGEDAWAESILRASHEGRVEDVSGVRIGGYDIETAAQALVERYLNLLGRR